MHGELSGNHRLNTYDAAEIRHIQSPMSDTWAPESLNCHGELEVRDEVQRIGRKTERGTGAMKIDSTIGISGPARDWSEKISGKEVAHLVNAFEEALS